MSGRLSKTSIYLDWNATTPPHPDVIDAMQAAARTAWGNPASTHRDGRRARDVVESAREVVAGLLAVPSRDVVFTSGATEANNLALRSARALITSRLEHPSVVRVAEALEREGRPVAWVRVPPSGRIEPDDVRAALLRIGSDAIVALMAANHETGVLQPLREVAIIAKEAGARLHVDAVQAAGKVTPDEWRHGDSFSLAAHKLRGPKGIGALVIASGILPAPVLLGGSQERGLRPGTVDPVSAAGFAAAVRRLVRGGPERHANLGALRDRVELAVSQLADVNGVAPRLPHVTNLSVHGWSGDELVAALDLAGVAVSAGSACSAGTSSPSPVITAMAGTERAKGAIRISLGDETTSENVDLAISLLVRIVTGHPSAG